MKRKENLIQEKKLINKVMMKLMNLKVKDMKIHCVTKRQEINRVEAIDIFERN